MPCLNPVPERRPTIHHVVQVLDKMINDVVSSLRLLLPLHEQESLLQGIFPFFNRINNLEIQMRVFEGKDAELEVAYRHLLSKPPNEVDELIKQSFKVDIDPLPSSSRVPTTSPPIQYANVYNLLNLRPGANRFVPGRNYTPASTPSYAPSFGSGMNFPMQPVITLMCPCNASRPLTPRHRTPKTSPVSTPLTHPITLSRLPSNKPLILSLPTKKVINIFLG